MHLAPSRSLVALLLICVVGLTAACRGIPEGALRGSIDIDGSSTAFPITEAVAEEFRYNEPGIRVTVGVSGTGGGFQRFCRGETAISNASRPIRQSEVEACAASGIDFIELPVAYDGLAVVVNPQNDWASCMTVAELKRLWEPEAQGKIMRWSQIREGWPDERIRLFGPGTDSGTFDYFTEAVVGQTHASRGDFSASEDDNVLVQGVAGDRFALGYFGLAYLEENLSRIKGVAIDGGNGCVEPSSETVAAGAYRPLSRPLLIYVRSDAFEREEVHRFIDFYLDHAALLAEDVGYVEFPEHYYELITERWETGRTGSMFLNAPPGASLDQLLRIPPRP
jgi:phosphate transport system substrate-binding protein